MTLEDLALVHATAAKPLQRDGQWVVQTSFKRAGGFAQDVGSDRLKGRQTLHFTLQSAVTDHLYGQFQGRQWMVVAPLDLALAYNHQPESLIAADVAFFPENGEMALPGSWLLEFASDLPEEVFIERNANTLRVAQAITPQNRGQAQAWFSELSSRGADVSAIEDLLASGHAIDGAQLTEMGVSSALALMGKPSLHNLKKIPPAAPMSFLGWMDVQELRALSDQIQSRGYMTNDLPSPALMKHDGMPGDRLFSAVSRLNYDMLSDLMASASTPLRIRSAIDQWQGSDFLRVKRGQAILKEITRGAHRVEDDLGRESPGLVSSLFARHQSTYHHPTLGTIELSEVMSTLSHLGPERKEQLVQILDERSMEKGASFAAFQSLATSMKRDLPGGGVPPPAPPGIPVAPPPPTRLQVDQFLGSVSPPPPPRPTDRFGM